VSSSCTTCDVRAFRSHATLRLLVLSTLGFDAAKFGRDRLHHRGIVDDWAGTVFKQRDSVLRTVCFAFFIVILSVASPSREFDVRSV